MKIHRLGMLGAVALTACGGAQPAANNTESAPALDAAVLSTTAFPAPSAPYDAGYAEMRDTGADASAALDACTPGAADLPDDMGQDSNCDGADGVVGKDVYVDPQAGQDTNDGSPKAPLQTLSAAATLAAARGGHILVAAGEIDGDTLPLTGSWSLAGGYAATFQGAPNRQLTVLAPSAAGLLIDASTTSGAMAHVTVRGRSPDATTPLVAAHALRSRAARLLLDDVVLRAGDARGGAAGDPGDTGATPADGLCGGIAAPGYALGQRYQVASPDGVTAPASLTPSGPVAAAQAQSGYAGGDGANAPAAIQIDGTGLVIGAPAAAGLSDGTPGYGGAGGLEVSQAALTVWGGRGGNGGCPGSGGHPGQSGGSSVALVVLAGEVDVTRSELHAGFGGTGGNGGAGGAGGVGQQGLPPELVEASAVPTLSACTPRQVGAASDWASCMPPSCTLVKLADGGTNDSDDPLGLSCAEYGGQGGNGGSGGAGGAGAGGWSVGVLNVAGAKFTLDGATSIAVAKAGGGGVGPSMIYAPAGRSLPTLVVDATSP